MSALDQVESAKSQSKAAGNLAKVASTNVDAIIREDAKAVKRKLQTYVQQRDKFITEALGVSTIEGGGGDDPLDYSGLFQ